MFKEYRKKLKLTQEDLADKSNLNTRTVQRIENNEEIPNIETLAKLVYALEISDKVLVEYTNLDDEVYKSITEFITSMNL